jgi:hypothetical protein
MGGLSITEPVVAHGVEQRMEVGARHRIDILPVACNDDRAMPEVIRGVGA